MQQSHVYPQILPSWPQDCCLFLGFGLGHRLLFPVTFDGFPVTFDGLGVLVGGKVTITGAVVISGGVVLSGAVVIAGAVVASPSLLSEMTKVLFSPSAMATIF